MNFWIRIWTNPQQCCLKDTGKVMAISNSDQRYTVQKLDYSCLLNALFEAEQLMVLHTLLLTSIISRAQLLTVFIFFDILYLFFYFIIIAY